MKRFRKNKFHPKTETTSVTTGKSLDESILQRCLFVTSLLSQFKIGKVRQDFKAGMFTSSNLLEVTLEELDLFHSQILPSWDSGHSIQKRLKIAQYYLQDLVSGSSKLFKLGGNFLPRTFLNWNKVLYELAGDSYWDDSETEASVSPNCPQIGLECTSDKPAIVSILDVRDIEGENKIADADAICNVTAKVKQKVQSSIQPLPFKNYLKTLPLNENTSVGDHTQSIQISPSTGISLAGRQSTSCAAPAGIKHWSSKCQHSEVTLNKLNVTSCPSESVLRCSKCGGSHLGMYCWKFQTVQSCFWCGKRGHTEEKCWRKSGACLICGSATHKLKQCPRFVPLYSAVFPPWCPKCGCTHLGNDCDTPYME